MLGGWEGILEKKKRVTQNRASVCVCVCVCVRERIFVIVWESDKTAEFSYICLFEKWLWDWLFDCTFSVWISIFTTSHSNLNLQHLRHLLFKLESATLVPTLNESFLLALLFPEPIFYILFIYFYVICSMFYIYIYVFYLPYTLIHAHGKLRIIYHMYILLKYV